MSMLSADDREFLPLPEFAARFGAEERAVREACKAGKLRCRKLGGRLWFVHISELSVPEVQS